jgi:hypothetical protein
VVGFRAEPEHLIVTDQEALISWCRNHLRGALQIRIEALGEEGVQLEALAKQKCTEARFSVAVWKSVINRHFDECGEVPPGAELTPRTDLLMIK